MAYSGKKKKNLTRQGWGSFMQPDGFFIVTLFIVCEMQLPAGQHNVNYARLWKGGGRGVHQEITCIKTCI